MTSDKQNLELDFTTNKDLKIWCDQFLGVCPDDGDVYPPDYKGDPRGVYLGGQFITRINGTRFYIRTEDLGWERYGDGQSPDGCDPVGSNKTVTTLVDIDKPELVFDYDEAEYDEADRFQGVAFAVARAIFEKDAYPEGNWADVVEIFKNDWGIFDN